MITDADRWTIYNSDGEITSYISGDEAVVQLNLQAGEAAVMGDFDKAAGYFLNGVFTPYSSGEAALKSQRPSPFSKWSNASMDWLDPRNIDTMRKDKWESVKVERDAAEAGGFVWDGSTFDSDAVSQGKVQGAALAALIASSQSQPFSVDWTLADNTVRTLSASEMLAVGEAMLAHINSVHDRGRLLRVEISTASEEQLKEIEWKI